MKIFEIREMVTDEIKKRILEDQKNLVDLKFQQELKQLTNTAKLRLVRKDIAKMKTILKEREMQETKNSKANNHRNDRSPVPTESERSGTGMNWPLKSAIESEK